MPPNPSPDLSRACWRCQHWGGLVADSHGNCMRPNGTLQASPATGCVYWKAGPGDTQPPDWLPPGYKLREKVVIWGNPVAPDERPPTPPRDERPGTPTAAAEWDRQNEAQAWRATDALLERARRSG